MKLALSELPKIVEKFLEHNVLPQANDMQRFVTGCLMYGSAKRLPSYLSHPMVAEGGKVLGLLDAEGMLDVEYAKEMATAGLRKAGGSVIVANYSFDNSDVEAIYELMREIAQRKETYVQ